MKQYNIDPTRPQEFHRRSRMSTAFINLEDNYYYQRVYENLKREAGNELYSILEHMTSPVVVELEEKLPDLTKIGDITVRDYVDAEIIVKVTPVQHEMLPL